MWSLKLISCGGNNEQETEKTRKQSGASVCKTCKTKMGWNVSRTQHSTAQRRPPNTPVNQTRQSHSSHSVPSRGIFVNTDKVTMETTKQQDSPRSERTHVGAFLSAASSQLNVKRTANTRTWVLILESEKQIVSYSPLYLYTTVLYALEIIYIYIYIHRYPTPIIYIYPI